MNKDEILKKIDKAIQVENLYTGQSKAQAAFTVIEPVLREALVALEHNETRYGVNWRQQASITTLRAILGEDV